MTSALSPLERLSFADAPGFSRSIGVPGELQWLPLKQLFIDRSYQRNVLESGKKNIRTIVEQFSWALFGVLVVAHRGTGKYAIIDGQHRALAAVYRGDIEKLPCLVLKGGIADEALAFAAINGNVTRVHALQSFRAKVVAQEKGALAVVAVANAADVKIAPYPKTEQWLSPGETLALGSIQVGAKKHGDALVIAALKMLRAMDPSAPLSGPAIQGAIRCLSAKREWVSRAQEHGRKIACKMADLVSQASQRKAGYGGPLYLSFEAILTSKIEAEARASGRFASDEMRKRAMGGR